MTKSEGFKRAGFWGGVLLAVHLYGVMDAVASNPFTFRAIALSNSVMMRYKQRGV